MGVAYPKQHDVGLLVVLQVHKKRVAIKEEDLNHLQAVSRRLAEVRAPAFYGEAEFSKQEADASLADARWVVALVERVMGSDDRGSV
jgi:HEPN domain-containing protein